MAWLHQGAVASDNFLAGHLGVDWLVDRLLAKVLLGTHQGLPDGRFAAPRGSQQEDTPPHHKDLPELTDLKAKCLIWLIAQLNGCLFHLAQTRPAQPSDQAHRSRYTVSGACVKPDMR